MPEIMPKWHDPAVNNIEMAIRCPSATDSQKPRKLYCSIMGYGPYGTVLFAVPHQHAGNGVYLIKTRHDCWLPPTIHFLCSRPLTPFLEFTENHQDIGSADEKYTGDSSGTGLFRTNSAIDKVTITTGNTQGF